MRLYVSKLALISALALGSAASAQEGHPVKGSWIGEWKGNQQLGEFVLVIMDWDGEKITGVINPGTDNINIEEASLNPDDWTVNIQGGGYEIEGTIQSLELPSRSIVGTWRSDNGNGDFEIVRQ